MLLIVAIEKYQAASRLGTLKLSGAARRHSILVMMPHKRKTTTDVTGVVMWCHYFVKGVGGICRIGDKSGQCATLFNIGHIHLQKEEVPQAYKAWVTVYRVARSLQLAQALQTLEVLAGELGLPGGMAGWETLAAQIEGE